MVTDKRKEKISAFLDNDMHRDELMSFSLSSESDDAKIAQRYQMLGDNLRGEMSDASFIDVSAAVHDAVAEIPMADLPEYNQAASAEQVTSPVTSQVTSRSGSVNKPLWNFSAWFKPVAGMAMAVTVAVVMVMTVTEQDTAGIAPLATNTDVQPSSVQLASDTDTTGLGPLNAEAPVSQHLVNQHLEFATQDTLQGRLPYVRAVSFEPGKSMETGQNIETYNTKDTSENVTDNAAKSAVQKSNVTK